MKRIFSVLGLVFMAEFSALSYAAQSNDHLLTVVDEANRPVPQATILIGYEPGSPFQGNLLVTDANGTVQFSEEWKSALPLTVQAPGFVTSTLPVANPALQTLRLHHLDPQNDLEVKGTATEFGPLPEDGKVDFGLVIPALRREQILSFDVSSLLSPQQDTLSIVGQEIHLPSNITLPHQRETYIFPIDLNKPDYRMYARQPGDYKVTITHGQFPLNRVVSGIRAGKSFLDLVNYFDFKQAGQADLQLESNLAGINIPVNQVTFNSSVNVKAPAFGSNQSMLTLALVQQGDVFLPTDLKRLTANQSLALKSRAGAGDISTLSLLMENQNAGMMAITETLQEWFAPLVLVTPGPRPSLSASGGRVTQDFAKLSFSLVSANDGAAPQFLPLINKPSLDGQVLTFDKPALIEGLESAGMYVTLASVETTMEGTIQLQRRTRQWEIWSDAWLSRLELPKITISRNANTRYIWDVLYLARPKKSASRLHPELEFKTITHATRNSVDI